MKFALAIILAVFALGAAPAARAGQGNQQAPPPGPAPIASTNENSQPLQSLGKAGGRPYNWTNGWAWMQLGDDAKVSMVVGIEQGVVLSVREHWDALQKSDQSALVKTAERLTVGGVPFNEVVLEMDKLYLDPNNDRIPVVDAYLYVVLEKKKTPPNQLKKYLDGLRKTYAPPIAMKPLKPFKGQAGNP